MKYVLIKSVVGICLLLIPLNSYAQTKIEERMKYHNDKLETVYKEHTKIYKMISKMCIKELGYETYREIVLSPDEEVKNEK